MGSRELKKLRVYVSEHLEHSFLRGLREWRGIEKPDRDLRRKEEEERGENQESEGTDLCMCLEWLWHFGEILLLAY